MTIDYSIDVIVLVVICLSALSQILFGVGVLLWGTPALVMIGYEFIEVLFVLLPISFCISIFQVYGNIQHISRRETLRFMQLSLPCLIVGLGITLSFDLNVEILVFMALLLGGVLRLEIFKRYSNRIGEHKSFLLPFVGLVHGMSNLGGSLLVLWASYGNTSKISLRTMVAVCYSCLAFFQIITLRIVEGGAVFFPYYFSIGVGMYLVISNVVFSSINSKLFNKLLTILMFGMAMLVGVRIIGAI